MMIQTERLVLRELEPMDLAALYKVLADSDIMKLTAENMEQCKRLSKKRKEDKLK